MRNASFLIGTAVVLAICCTIVSRAGDLDPPQGAIAPSMHTIDDLYALMGQQNPNRPWRSKVIETPSDGSNADQVIFPAGTSGIVHAMIYARHESFDCLEMDPDSQPLFRVSVGNASDNVSFAFPLDVQFSNGLRMRTLGAWQALSYTIIYREDAVISPPRP